MFKLNEEEMIFNLQVVDRWLSMPFVALVATAITLLLKLQFGLVAALSSIGLAATLFILLSGRDFENDTKFWLANQGLQILLFLTLGLTLSGFLSSIDLLDRLPQELKIWTIIIAIYFISVVTYYLLFKVNSEAYNMPVKNN
jgi:hypothetical protein